MRRKGRSEEMAYSERKFEIQNSSRCGRRIFSVAQSKHKGGRTSFSLKFRSYNSTYLISPNTIFGIVIVHGMTTAIVIGKVIKADLGIVGFAFFFATAPLSKHVGSENIYVCSSNFEVGWQSSTQRARWYESLNSFRCELLWLFRNQEWLTFFSGKKKLERVDYDRLCRIDSPPCAPLSKIDLNKYCSGDWLMKAITVGGGGARADEESFRRRKVVEQSAGGGVC